LKFIPGFGGSQRLPRLVGLGIVKEFLYTGRNVTAEEAIHIGLVDSVVPAAFLMMDATIKTAKQISCYSEIILLYLKTAVNRRADIDLYRSMDIEKDLFELCFATKNHLEGCNAFLENGLLFSRTGKVAEL
jgi:enoyl-CoA hydratase